jgi:hypothetical protein
LHPKEPRLIRHHGIGTIVLEAVMIVLSILLALGLENWNEHRREAVKCRTALGLIRQEINGNRKEIASLLEKHKTRADGLIAAAGVLTKEKRRPSGVDGGLEFAGHRSTVFDAAMSGRALGPLDYGTLLPVMESYSSHPWLQKLEDVWLQQVLQVDPSADREKLARQLLQLAGILQGYRQIEETAVVQCDSAMAAIDRVLGKGE